jgi:hypothetical protein
MNSHRLTLFLCLASVPWLGLALVPTASVAGEGVIEINQVCAERTGCLAGDSPGFPVEVNLATGSFRLTSNLTVPDADTSAIRFTGPLDGTRVVVGLDMNGFTISGPVLCFGSPIECDAAGTGNGVFAFGTLSIGNGTIRGFGANGISMGFGSRVSDMLVLSNAGDGIRTEFGSTAIHIENSTISANGGYGVFASFASSAPGSVQDCTIANNGLDGLVIGDSLIVNNRIRGNGGNGISSNTGDWKLITGNVVSSNAGSGIRTSKAAVADNVVAGNADVGLAVVGNVRYSDNTFVDNNGGFANPQVSGSGWDLGGNSCGPVPCP